MTLRQLFHHLYDVYNDEADVDWNHDWGFILAKAILTITTGGLLPAAYWMQRWCTASSWDHEDRWAGTKQLAITLLLLVYVPLISNLVFFHIQLVQWPQFSPTLAWLNLLEFASYMCLWWILLLPLAPTLALILECIDPRTKNLERVLLPWEQSPPPKPLENVKTAKLAGKKAMSDDVGKIPKKRKKGRARPIGELLLEDKTAREQQAQAVQQQLPLSDSLEQTPSVDISVPSSTLSSEPLPPRKSNRGNRESLKDLF